MMRSLYSGVSGLKTHQTKMDVIGNNISNVNTVAFKSSTVTFSDIMYQTTTMASGPNALTGSGGINAKQIGLGVTMATTTQNITTGGATQTTGSALDCKINGNSFFVVSDGTNNYFTRVGAFYFDSVGNLCMQSTGYNVMGWQVDPTTGEIKKDTVSALRIMQASNLISSPEATTKAVVSGVLDKNSTAVNTDAGYIMSLNFYDNLGYQYTAKFKVTENADAGEGYKDDGKYRVTLTDVLDSDGKTVLTNTVTAGDIFGTGISKSDTGSLLSGRSPESATFDDFAANSGTPFTGYNVIAANGTTTTGTPKMNVHYLKDGNGTIIEGSTVYIDDDGHMYGADITKDDTGKVTAATFYSLGLADPNYAGKVATWKAYYRSYFADNYAGVDPDIYVNGNSTWVDATKYTSVMSMNGYTFETQEGYKLVPTYDTSDPTIVTSYALTKDGAAVAGLDQIDSNSELYSVLTNPAYISTTADDSTIHSLLPDTDNGEWKSATVKQSTFNTVQLTGLAYFSELEFNTDDGTFVSIGKADAITMALSNLGGNFENVSIDFTASTMYDNKGTSTLGMTKGGTDGSTGAGKKLGAMTGVSIDNSGRIYGSYDNGNTVLLGQIAVAKFANASGLEQIGESCYQTTLNSGEFDGIGVDITADGGSLTTGALEMSNVDLSNEFTDMITTQRGFQANSRVITTSDTLLEELINLKR